MESGTEPLRYQIAVLVNLIREGEATQEDMKELEQMVLGSPEACRVYNDVVYLECGLRWNFGVDENLSTAEEMEDPLEAPGTVSDLCDLNPEAIWGPITPKEPTEESDPSALGFIGDCFNNGLNFLSHNIVLIIVLLPLLAIGTVAWLSPSLWDSPHKGWTLAARVEKTIDCRWKPGGIRPTPGSFLIPGQKVELELGLAEFKFASGATVILQGPAEFLVTDENASDLSLGRLAAIVPDGAEGFTVKTPNMDVIDLGTEFGVVVEEDGNTDVHVFKGEVETKVTKPITPVKKKAKIVPSQKKKRELRLEKDQAVQYDNKTDDIVSIPVDKKRFVRSLERGNGVTANLRITNPSFELPNIRRIPEFQKTHGNTLFRPLYGWKVSDQNQNKTKVAMYQISPYRSLIPNCDIGPGATEGRQVATISLGIKQSPVGQPRSNWIYQSLGLITSADLGKTLKLSADAAPRHAYGNFPHGNGTVFAGFALQVTPKHSGTVVGTPGTFHQGTAEVEALHPLQAKLTITQPLVGQELFILLCAGDDGSNQDIYQYHFDNVEVEEE